MQRQATVQLVGPFLKWAGGKRQLLPALEALVPRGIKRYHEPFLGGGALAFRLMSTRPDVEFSGSDANADLIDAYLAARDRPAELISALRDLEGRYFEDPEPCYYSVRGSEPRGRVQRAARLLFLNRTCYNGLYRVNSRGRFNVPHGKYERPNIVNEKKVRAAGELLRSRRARISCRDFSSVLDEAERGDFVYFDPPYLPASPTAFTAYTCRGFGRAQLEELARACAELDSRGVLVMLSNTDARAVSDMFRGWHARHLASCRMVNSAGSGRTGHTDLLLTNYKLRAGSGPATFTLPR